MGTAASVNYRGKLFCRKCRSKSESARNCKECRGSLCIKCCPHRYRFADTVPAFRRNSSSSRQRLDQDRRETIFSRNKLLVSNPVENASYSTKYMNTTKNAMAHSAPERHHFQRLETRTRPHHLGDFRDFEGNSRTLNDLQASSSRMFYERDKGRRTSNASVTTDNGFEFRSIRTRDSLRSDVLELDSLSSVSYVTDRPRSFIHETGSRDKSLRPNSFRSETNDRTSLERNSRHQSMNTRRRQNKKESKLFKFIVPRSILPGRSKKHEENANMYGSIVIPSRTGTLHEHPRAHASQKMAECATHTHDGKLVILCSYYFKEKLCECCMDQTFIVLSFPDDEDLQFSDFIHCTECGDMTSSTSVEKTFFTLPKRHTVYTFFRGSNIYEAFKTPGECYGITYFDKGLAISVLIEADFHLTNKWMVILVRYNGKIKRRIVDRYNDNVLFKEPKYLASNQSGDTLFVSDIGKRAIIAFNTWGAMLFEYTDVNLRVPRGITVDTDDNIYVADGTKVVQIKANGMVSNTLLSTKNDQEIAGLSFDNKSCSLVVVQRNGTFTEFSFSS